MTTAEILKKAKELSVSSAPLDTGTKNNAIMLMADALEAAADSILEATEPMLKTQGVK